MKNFFKTIGASFHSSELYKKAKGESVWVGIKFVLKVATFIGLCLGVIGLVAFLLFSPMLKKLVVNFADKAYPSYLVVTIKDGKLISNTSGPIYVPSPFLKAGDTTSPKNLVVLAPGDVADMTVLTKYDTLSAITSNGFVSSKANKGVAEQIKIYPYNGISKVYTKDLAMSDVNRILRALIIFIAIFIIPMVVIMMLGNAILCMFGLLVTTLLVWGLMKLKKLNITYKQAYKMGIYALVPVLFLEIINIPIHLHGIIFTSVVVLIVLHFATRTWKKDEEAAFVNSGGIIENK